MLTPDDWRQHVVLGYAVLQRDDAGVRSDEREDLLRGRFRIAELHREDHHVDLADGRGIIGRLHGGQMDRSIPLKRNAILPECLQLLAPRDERHVSPALLQARPVIAADSARTHDRDLQGALPCCLFAAADRHLDPPILRHLAGDPGVTG